MLAKFKLSHPQLDGILNKNDVINLESTYDEKGYINGYKFVSKDGNTYTDYNLRAVLGNKCLAEMFDKVKE